MDLFVCNRCGRLQTAPTKKKPRRASFFMALGFAILAGDPALIDAVRLAEPSAFAVAAAFHSAPALAIVAAIVGAALYAVPTFAACEFTATAAAPAAAASMMPTAATTTAAAVPAATRTRLAGAIGIGRAGTSVKDIAPGFGAIGHLAAAVAAAELLASDI